MESNYPLGFYFEVSCLGETNSFQEVGGLSKEMNVEEVVAGGENRFKYRLPTTAKGSNLSLKRALLLPNSKLAAWCASIMDLSLTKAISPQDVTVKLLNNKGQASKVWLFHQAYPVKYSISDLKSQENAIVMESVELAYTFFNIMNSSKIKKYMK